MKYTLGYTDEAISFLKKIDRSAAVVIIKKIESICEDPIRFTTPLRGHAGVSRLRVGDYRVLLSIEQNTIHVTVISIGHRKNIYQ